VKSYITNTVVLLFLFCIKQLCFLSTVVSFNFVLFIIKHHCESRDSKMLSSMNTSLGIRSQHFYCAIGLRKALPGDYLEYITSNTAVISSM